MKGDEGIDKRIKERNALNPVIDRIGEKVGEWMGYISLIPLMSSFLVSSFSSLRVYFPASILLSIHPLLILPSKTDIRINSFPVSSTFIDGQESKKKAYTPTVPFNLFHPCPRRQCQ